jgi:hypothetical protein
MRDKNNHERVRQHKRDLQHFLIRIPAAIHPRRQPQPSFSRLASSMIEPAAHNHKSPARDKKNDPLQF